MGLSSQQRDVIRRCQQSAIWFMRNFVKIKHPGAGIVKFDPFDYQQNAIRCFRKHRMNIFRKTRQCGISKVSGIFALWFAMFSAHKTILIVSRKDEDAISFLAENVKLPFTYLPEWMRDLWKPAKDNEHELFFPNGSKIRSLTSHPDVLRSNASSLNIIDEAAFIQDMDVMWAAGRPVITHGGGFIIISTCVAGDTYVITEHGMKQIKDFDGGYTGYNSGYYHKNYDGPSIFGVSGLQQPTTFYKRPVEETRVITSKCGYELEAHIKHRILVYRNGGTPDWLYADEVKPGDFVPIKRGMMQFGNDNNLMFSDGPDKYHPSSLTVDVIDEELAEIIGIIVSEGYINDTYVTVTSGDMAIHDKLIGNHWGLVWSPEQRHTHIRCCSTRFARFLRWLGCEPGLAPTKSVPRRLWSCSQKIMAAFLRGLYDGDGHSRSRNGEVGYTSTSRTLIKQLRVILLNFGIITREEYKPAYEREFNLNNRQYVSQCNESWQLIIRSGEAAKFYDLIGFGLARKGANSKLVKKSREFVPGIRCLVQQLRKDVGVSIGMLKRGGIHAWSLLFKKKKRDLTERGVLRKLLSILSDYKDRPQYQAMEELADESIYWDEITSVTKSSAETFDFTIPGDHTFWSNGMISHNTNGLGGWYWNTWTDAEAGANDFNPLMVNWWDMKWAIEYQDALSGTLRRIAPTDGILPTAPGTYGYHPRYGKVELSPDIYGPYWSPWLEEQYRDLQEKGEAWKFDQEILAAFVGSGNTVMPKSVLVHVERNIDDDCEVITGPQTYIHPVTGDAEEIDYTPTEPGEGLWIWRRPVTATPDKLMNGRIIEMGRKAHSYVAGVDIATGKGRDWHGIEIFDVDAMEQVAEGMFHCLPAMFKKIVDRLGRWYNTAIMVVERNNGGDMFIDDLNTEFNYPRLWRRTEFTGKTISKGQYGFFTSSASKPSLNKFLLDYIRDKDGEGFRIYSRRLLKQLQIYVRKRDKAGRDTGRTEAEAGTGNHDDLVMAAGLALIAVPDSYGLDAVGVVPYTNKDLVGVQRSMLEMAARQKELIAKGGAMMPMTFGGGDDPAESIEEEIMRFTTQLGGLPIITGVGEQMKAVSKKKHQL